MSAEGVPVAEWTGLCVCGHAINFHHNTVQPQPCAECGCAAFQLKETSMHYKNGREAKNGDKVLFSPPGAWAPPVAGILYDAVAGNDACNGRLAPMSKDDPYPNLAECLHLDDAKEALDKATNVKV